MDGSNHGAYIRVDTYVAARVGKDAMLKTALLPALTPELKGYLSSRFTLRDGDRPHMMKF